MYRQQHHIVNYKSVTEFLIANPENSQSMIHCVHAANNALTPVIAALNIDVPAVAEMQELQQMLDDVQIEDVLTKGLHEFIDTFHFNLNIVDQAIYEPIFAKVCDATLVKALV
jgi:uncharacterized alpha-E superfamily protein